MSESERMTLLKEITRIVVSVVVILIGCGCIFNSDQTLQKVGVGMVATVTGYWLR